MTRLGMDVGSVSTVVCNAEGEFLYDEPSVLLHQRSGGRGEHITIGRAAAELIGRLPPGVTALRPVRHGVITDLHTARSYLRAVVRQILPRPWQRARIQPYSAASYRLTTAPTEVGAPPAHTDQPIGPGCDKGVQPDVHRSSRNTLGHRLEEIGASAAT